MFQGSRAGQRSVTYFARPRPLLRCCRRSPNPARLIHNLPSPYVVDVERARSGKLDETEATAQYTRGAIYGLHRALIRGPYWEITKHSIEQERQVEALLVRNLSLDHRPLALRKRALRSIITRPKERSDPQAEQEDEAYPLERFRSTSWPASSRLIIGRRFVIRYVVDKAAAEQLVRHFARFRAVFCEGLSRRKAKLPVQEVLKLLNAVLERLDKFDVRPSTYFIFYGLQVAARAQSTGALQRYLNLAASTRHYTIRSRDHLDSIFKDIETWACTSGSSLWAEQRRKAELTILLIGRASSHEDQDHRLRQTSFLALLGFRAEWISHSFYRLLGLVGGQEALFRVWTMLKEIGGQQSPKDLALHIIPELVRIGGLERAWDVYYESTLQPRDLDETVLWSMFDRPDLLRQWHADMVEPMMRKYLHTIEFLEDMLNISWSGGEDGFHKYTPRLEMSSEITATENGDDVE